MRKSKVYFDSNIWIHYLWIEKVSFPKEFLKENLRKERSHKIVTSLDSLKYKVIASLFIESEISGYFENYLRYLRGLSKGFDYTNCHKYKKHFSLRAKEAKEIASYFEEIAELNSVEVVAPILDDKSLAFFRTATCSHYIDYVDALHLIIALAEGCKYLITEDKDFRKKGNKLLKDSELIQDLRIVNVKEAVRHLK